MIDNNQQQDESLLFQKKDEYIAKRNGCMTKSYIGAVIAITLFVLAYILKPLATFALIVGPAAAGYAIIHGLLAFHASSKIKNEIDSQLNNLDEPARPIESKQDTKYNPISKE